MPKYLAGTSAIAWAHIAFTGKYRFKKSNGEIDIEAMVEALEKHLKQHFFEGALIQVIILIH